MRQPMKSSQRWIIVDGRNLLWRATSAMEELQAGKRKTGGAYGFLVSLLRIHSAYNGRIVIAWEGSDRNFRYDIFPAYKPRTPSDERDALVKLVIEQESILRQLLKYAGIAQYIGTACEADDVIGTLAIRKYANAESVLIYSMDSDLRQLVGGNVKLVSPSWSGEEVLYDADKVVERYGVPPASVAELKALMGDASDGVPGVRGLGLKTAVKLLVAYGTLDRVMEAAVKGTETPCWPVAERFRCLVKSELENLRLYRQVTRIKTDIPLKVIKPTPNTVKLLKSMQSLKYRSLINRLRDIMALGQ